MPCFYSDEIGKILTTSSQNGTPTDTVYFDAYTETVIAGGSTTTTKYYSINGQRLAERVGGSTIDYLVSDLLGNQVLAINNVGSAIAVQLYEPYGQMNFSWGSMPTAHNYTGQRLDSQSGLLYYNFRWYDPLSGQFVRTDTKQTNAQGFNPYEYVNDNPETKNDPTGHWGWGDLIAATVVAVVAVAVVAAVVVAAPVVIAAGAAAYAGGAGAAGIATAVATTAYVGSILGPDAVAASDDAAAAMDDAAQAADDTNVTANGDDSCGDDLSFTQATLVTTNRGKQAISKLKVGETVWAYNPKTKRMELEPIQKVWLNHDDDLVDLTLIATVKDSRGKTIQQKEVIHTNEKHPFFTKEKGFIPVNEIKPGMHVLQADGHYGVVAKLLVVPGAMWMYNLTVAQDHTYVVGSEQWIVHNFDCTKVRQPNQRHFYSRIKQGSPSKPLNTVILPGTDVNSDIAEIRSGSVPFVGGQYVTSSGRVYGVEGNGTLIPISGPGFVQASQGAYTALATYRSIADASQAELYMDNMRGGAGIPAIDRAWARMMMDLYG